MRKKSISLKGHRTSIALEPVFWEELEEAAKEAALTLPALIDGVDRRRLTQTPAPGLASALRVYVVNRLRVNADKSAPSGVGDKTDSGPAKD